jgi:hypothetical protein
MATIPEYKESLIYNDYKKGKSLGDIAAAYFVTLHAVKSIIAKKKVNEPVEVIQHYRAGTNRED